MGVTRPRRICLLEEGHLNLLSSSDFLLCLLALGVTYFSSRSPSVLMVSLIFPNLSEDPDQSPDKLPYLIFESKAKVKVAIEQDAKTFQITEKRQKVFGLDVS